MLAQELVEWADGQGVTVAYRDIVARLTSGTPEGVAFADDRWDVIDWATRVTNKEKYTLNFAAIAHEELRVAGKMWVLDGRLKRSIGPSSATLRTQAMSALGEVLKGRPMRTLTSGDFKEAERFLARTSGRGTAYRVSAALQGAADWLRRVFSLRLDYSTSLANPVVHGRYGTDDGRAEKLIPIEVLRDLMLALKRDDLSTKDRLYLSLLAVNIGAGFRIAEIAALPSDCLIKESGVLQIRVFSEKGGRPVARPVHPQITDVVEHAIGYIREFTNPGRVLAQKLRENGGVNWPKVIQDHEVLTYFVKKWAHEWTSFPAHQMINRNGAWYSKTQSFVDAIGALAAAGGNKSLAAQSLDVDRNTFYRLLKAQEAARCGKLPEVDNARARGKKRQSWDTDARVISVMKLEAHMGLLFKGEERRALVKAIISEAQALQLEGKVYPAPSVNAHIERAFRRELMPLIRDRKGKGILYPDEALLVVEKYSLSEHRNTKSDDFRTLSEKDIGRWLSGEKRARGSGGPEDTVFNRLGILDPRTGETAQFTWHSIRHWLDTTYENGGFTQDQIALIFNRKCTAQNAVYDQTSKRDRTERLVEGIREKMVLGSVTETYHRIAECSRDEAEEFLIGAVRQVNPMPHGLCTLDWATSPCPHHLSCFKHDGDGGGTCEHLIVNAHDREQVDEIKRNHRTAALQVSMLAEQMELSGVEESPQIEHFRHVRENTGKLLRKIEALLPGVEYEDRAS